MMDYLDTEWTPMNKFYLFQVISKCSCLLQKASHAKKYRECCVQTCEYYNESIVNGEYVVGMVSR